MRTHAGILSLVMVLGATACNDADNKSMSTITDGENTIVVDDKSVVVVNEEAIARRGARMDGMTACIRLGNADTWKHLSLTTDQIRWMEQLQGRMLARNEKAAASVDKEPAVPTSYTFNTSERRKLAEILTDEQLDEWTAMCPDHVVVSAR